MPASPDWAHLPKRICGDCGKRYKPYRPLRENEVGFCSDNCRKSYHKHGGAYRKLRGLVRNMVEQEFAEMRAEQQQIRALLARLTPNGPQAPRS